MRQFSILLGILTCLSISSDAQVIYREDFSSVVLTGGVGHLPAGMTTVRVDTLHDSPDYRNVPFNDTAFSDEGFAVRTLGGNPCAIGTTLVQSGGFVDRWLFLPVVAGNNSDTKLEWRETRYTPVISQPCSYEVWVTSDTSGPPVPSQFTALASNRVYQNIASQTGIHSHAVTLAAFPQGGIRIAFRIREFNNPMRWQFAIDDIVVTNTPGLVNVATDIVYADRFVAVGDTSRIYSKITNTTFAITGYQWNIRVGNFRDSVIMTTSLPVGQSGTVSYDLIVPALLPGEYWAEYWVSKPSGADIDDDKTNDTLRQLIHIIAVPVNRNVLAEEFTGAWCGDCPEGGLEFDEVAANNNWLVPVSIHTSDSMTLEDGTWIAQSYNFGFPSMITDRRNLSGDMDYWAQGDKTQWETAAESRHQEPAVASVAVLNQTYDWSTRIFSVSVEVTFFNDATGPFAMNCWLTEDNVFGPLGDTTNNGWNNRSYHSADSSSVFFGMGAYLDPSEYVHNNVLVKMLTPSAWGDTTLIPHAVLAGNTFTFTFQDTLPVATGGAHIWIPQDMSVVAFVTLFNDYRFHQEVVNAGMMPFNTGMPEVDVPGGMVVYPNPTAGETFLRINLQGNEELQLNIVDVLGRNVSATQYVTGTTGQNIFTLNTAGLASGTYYVRVVTGTGVRYVPFVHSDL